jgi:hypothetical protein
MYYLRGWYANRDGYYPGGPDSLGGFAPLFSYSQYSQKSSLGFNHGMTMDGNLAISQASGVDTRVDYWQGDINQVDPPTPTERNNARNYKISDYAIALNQGGTTMQDWIEHTLASGNPVAVALNLYSPDVFSTVSAATNFVVYPPPAGSSIVNVHDVFAYKYDSTGLWIENQWGPGWADHGHAELSWAYVNQAVLEAASIVPVTPPPPTFLPSGSLVATRSGNLYRITPTGPVPLANYAAAGWATEYEFTEDESLPNAPAGEYDCTPTACTGTDDDPQDPVIMSIQAIAQYDGPPGWRYCAPENGTCVRASPTPIAYGVAGRFFYRLSVGQMACTNTAFQGDPAPGLPKGCFTLAAPPGSAGCAVEDGTCNLSLSTDVLYGAAGHYLRKYNVRGAVRCTNTAFGGDPAFGVKKGCFRIVGPAGFMYCATEGNACSLGLPTVVAYGAAGSYSYRANVVGIAQCANAVFGDPTPNVHKACFTNFAPPGYAQCAEEGGACAMSTPADIAYGANGSYTYRYHVSGNIGCNNTVFGDPVPNVRKACFNVAGPPGYKYCATEGQTCTTAVFNYVAYGAADTFFYKLVIGGAIDCTNTAFGLDPTPNVHKACFTLGWF